MRDISQIIIHASATPPSANIGAEEIREWHVTERGWRDIGYHYVIRRDGALEAGRPLGEPGAHAKGHNKESIGICLIGGIDEHGLADANFTRAQYECLRALVGNLAKLYEIDKDNIIGHRDLPEVSKECPCFDVRSFFEGETL